VVPEAHPCFESALRALDGSSLTLEFSCDPSDLEIEAGRIVVGVDDGGYLLRVESVERAGTTARLETSPAGLLEAVEKGRFHGVIEDSSRSTWSLHPDPIEVGPFTASLDVEIQFSPLVVVDGEIDLFDMVWFEASASGWLTGSITVTITADGAVEKNGVLEFDSIPVGAVMMWVGSFPILVGLEIEPEIPYRFFAEGSGSLQMTYSVAGFVDAGIVYTEAGGWRSTGHSDLSAGFEPVLAEVEIEAQARVGLALKTHMTVYSLPIAYIRVEPYAAFCAHYETPPPEWTWLYELGVEGSVGVEWDLGLFEVNEHMDLPGMPFVIASNHPEGE
jgi:hypothetical protein